MAIAAEFNNPVYSLVAKPENKSYADLKGKLIGVAAGSGSITLSIRKLLAMNGLGREDFRTRFVDGTPERLTCLTIGDCDAVPVGQPQDFVAWLSSIPTFATGAHAGAGGWLVHLSGSFDSARGCKI